MFDVWFLPSLVEESFLYMHVHNIKILFLFEVWNFWVGRARETTN